MPSSNYYYPQGSQTTIYNTTPGSSPLFFPTTAPVGKTRLALEVKNIGLDENVTKIQVLGYGNTTINPDSGNEIAEKTVTLTDGDTAYLGPGDNVNLANLSPGQVVLIYITLAGVPTTGDLRIDANWS